MKEAIIAFCTPDLNRPMACRAIEALRATDLSRAELMILDNVYDAEFHHPSVMQSTLLYAAGRPVIFMDDDAVVRQTDWIDRLFAAATESAAAVVGCVPTSPDGEPNHTAILVHADGTTSLAHQPGRAGQRFMYVPSVSSAVVLVLNDRGLRFDLRYEKYHHDTDIGVAAWAQGDKVACALDLAIMHVQADYASRVTNVTEVFARDEARFQQKWRSFAASLYEQEHLQHWKRLAESRN